MFNREERQAMLDARMKRGKDAEILLKNPLMAHALTEMELDVIKIMKSLRPDDEKGRDTAWRELRAIELFKKKLTQYVTYGKDAERSLFGGRFTSTNP